MNMVRRIGELQETPRAFTNFTATGNFSFTVHNVAAEREVNNIPNDITEAITENL